MAARGLGDPAAVARQTADPVEFERLVTSRNRMWLPQIETLLGEGKTTLIIAGAAHLVGENGVVNLLRKTGHEVAQLPRPAVGGAAPRIGAVRSQPGKSARLTLVVEPEQSYGIETSPDLVSWTPVASLFATNRTPEIERPLPGTTGPQFFRVRTPPRSLP